MANQKGNLEKIGREGFQIIEECYGRSHEGYRTRNYMYSSAPQTRTVFQEPVRTSHAYVVHHVDHQVPAGKQLYQAQAQAQAPIPASKEVVYGSKLMATRRDSYQVPQFARPVEPSKNGGNGTVTWRVYKVTQAPAPDAITSDQAVKNYGGIVSKQYYW